MAVRNIDITPGQGDQVKFDDNSQIVKMEYGPAGVHNLMEEQPATAAKQEAGNVSLSTIVSTLASMLTAYDPPIGKVVSGNVREKWKVGFSSMANFSANFTEVAKAASDLVHADGNVAGSNWVDFCKSAFTQDTETVYLAKKAFKVPYAVEVGWGLSQRFGGQEFYLEMVGVNADSDGNVTSVISTNPSVPADNPISANISVASNVWTITLTNQANTVYRVGDWVCLYGCADSRLNVGPLLITAIGSSANNIIQVTSTLADGTYTGFTGGAVRFVCPCGQADYHHGLRMWGTSNSNADTVSRNGVEDSTGNNNRARVVAWNPGNTQGDSAVPNEGGINYSAQPYTRSFRSKGLWRTEHTTGFLQWITKDQDSTTNVRATSYRESEVPAQDQWFALRIRARNLPNLSKPVGTDRAITAISKAGSTTWTVTCPGHGLTANARVRIYGVLDQANFPNLTTDTVVASVVSPDQFTIVSTTGTASSYGGIVLRVNGGAVPTLTTIAVASYNKSYDGLRLAVTGSGTWADVIGNIVDLCGLVTSGGVVQTALQGRYRVARQTTTLLELEPMDGQAAAVAAVSGSTTAGGTIVRNTSFRVHYARVLDYVRMLVEPANASNNTSRAMPMYITGGTPGTTTVQGAAAHDAAISGQPLRTGGRAVTANYTTVSNGDAADDICTLVGAKIVKPYSIPELDFGVIDSITNSTTAVQVKAATASNKNYVTGLSLESATLGGGTTVQLRSTPIASTTATISANTLVMAGTYNWKVGDKVYVTASGVTGLTAGSYYYILTVSGANLTFSATRGGSTLAISGTSVNATLSKVLWESALGTTAQPINAVMFPNPLDGGTGLAIEMCTPSATTGRIGFTVTGYVAP